MTVIELCGHSGLPCSVAELVKSFGLAGVAESLDDFRYSPTDILSCHKPLEGFQIVKSVDDFVRNLLESSQTSPVSVPVLLAKRSVSRPMLWSMLR